MSSNLRSILATLVSVMILAACGPITPAAVTSSQPASSPVPQATTSALTATLPAEPAPSWLSAGFRYEDPVDESLPSFLDVTAFQATVDAATQTLEAVFTLRDIPETAARGLVRNVVEYQWQVAVYLDPKQRDPDGGQPDYSLTVLSITLDASAGIEPTSEVNVAVTAAPSALPFDQLWTITTINDALNENVGSLSVSADPNTDTLTLRGVVPGLESGAGFEFATQPFGGPQDQADSFVPVGPAVSATDPGTGTAVPGQPAAEDAASLVPAGRVHAYPGPLHYEGDLLTLELLPGSDIQAGPVTLTLDDEPPREVSGQMVFDWLTVPRAVDTRGLAGKHHLRIQAGSGAVDEVYDFEVLPASARPANEVSAAWQSQDTPCCRLHYISGTAAARDIDLLADYFQHAAETLTAAVGRQIERPLQVYFLDRMWGNGAFGGNGELVVSYTDRYYGPTVDRAGWETLARHEFTHALGLDRGDDGFVIYNEGLAVYLAGGHFRPEPLPERAAALYDLGYAVPIGGTPGQHELNYLYGAALMTYIAETYGESGPRAFVQAADTPEISRPPVLDSAIQSSLGLSRADLDRGFQAWMESHEPGPQLDDLRLMVQLQDVRRQYQETYAPPPNFVAVAVQDGVARPEALPALVREPTAAANVATELMIAAAQQALVDGAYSQVEAWLTVLKKVISSGQLEEPLARDYLEIVLILQRAGYVPDILIVDGDQAHATVVTQSGALRELELQKTEGSWQTRP